MLKEEYLQPPFICVTIENGTAIVNESVHPLFYNVLPYPLGRFLDNVKPELSLTIIIIFLLIILRYIKLKGLKVRSVHV